MFLNRVWQKERWLAVCFVLFIAGQAFFTWKDVQTFPFVHWGMYSERQSPGAHAVYVLHLNGRLFNYYKLPENTTAFLFHKLRFYHWLHKQGLSDPMLPVWESRYPASFPEAGWERLQQYVLNDDRRIAAFPGWLRRYLGRVTGEPVRSVQLHVQEYHYKDDGTLRPAGKKELLYDAL